MTETSTYASNTRPTEHSTSRLEIPSDIPMVSLLGPRDELLKTIEAGHPGVDVFARGNQITITGPAGELRVVEVLIAELQAIVAGGGELTPEVVARVDGMLAAPAPVGEPEGQQAAPARPAEVLGLNILAARGRSIRPKTAGQKAYVDTIDANTIVFGVGPAGTGKTYLAMAKAVQALQRKEVNRIILTRPAVEAGERLGFLPGTLSDKIDPYLRPLYDALHDMLDLENIPRLLEAGTLEVAPLAYMRGRTLNDAFIILDEAQNTTPEQMKMFLTRLGFGSKMVITGDVTQIDLPGHAPSGLKVVREVLKDVEDIVFVDLSSEDVVRHRLVSDIVTAYGDWDASRPQTIDPKNAGVNR